MLSVMLVQRLQEVAAIRRERRPEQTSDDMISQCPLLAGDVTSD